ncbi:MAG: indole-3-glycerol phosphate synthase TrpC [Geothermobacteraceae bacterium]
MSILDTIIERKREEVASAVGRSPLNEQRSRCRDAEPTRDFAAALRKRSENGAAIIAEVKKGSPSKGIIRADFDPVAIARSYRDNGAACLSVLTDREFFFGDLAYLTRIRTAVDIPLLRKDFVIDRYQLYEGRAAGADAILLIAAVLEPSHLEDLALEASELGLDVLLEVHDEADLARSSGAQVAMVGINNRNLKTFVTDLAVSERLLPLLPAGVLPVAESGLNSRADIVRLQAAGARAFLIGESLMREPDPGIKLRELLGTHGGEDG